MFDILILVLGITGVLVRSTGIFAPQGCLLSGREEVILDDNSNEKPDDDFATKQRNVERWNFSRGLPVLVRKAVEDQKA